MALDVRRRHVAHLRTKWALINGLRLFWVAVVLWCEIGAFFWSLLGCRWPDQRLTPGSTSTHVLIVADPQVLDQRSYPGRPKWLMSLTRYVVDLNLRKSWNAVLAKLDPHSVVFLGDMLDSGRVDMGDLEYNQYYNRFSSVFRLDASVPVYYLPGNHDVNLGYSPTSSSVVRSRYRTHYGPFNQRVDIANHTLLMIDAPGLVDEDYRRHAAQVDFKDWPGTKSGPVNFLKSFARNPSNDTIILFSHIPFSRSDSASCGALREKGTIHPGVGHGYQNLLLRETSTFVLEHVRPSVVFSGDDHDYCEYMHTLADGSRVREVTVKSFSMAMGVRKPGFQLLSLASAPPSTFPYTTIRASTFGDMPCALPDQVKIYTHGYAPFALLTVLVLLIFNYKNHHARGITLTSPTSPLFYRPSPWLASGRRRSISIVPTPPLGSKSSEPALSDKQEQDVRFGLAPILESDVTDGVSSPMTSPEKERKGTALVAITTLLRPAQSYWTSGGRQRSWYSRASKDAFQVAWPTLWVYIIISLWMFWR